MIARTEPKLSKPLPAKDVRLSLRRRSLKEVSMGCGVSIFLTHSGFFADHSTDVHALLAAETNRT
jgi:hypothetical protein